MRPKAVADDWMVMIDASIQMGEKKCLLVLGCRQSNFPKNRALTLEDLEVLSLRIGSTLNANIITQVLKEVESTIGRIKSICSDRGSDMLRGIKDFQIYSPQTHHTNDTAHRIANFLEATLENSSRWKEFREKITQARRKMQNSLLSSFLPPSPRVKARYMNVDSLIIWAANALLLIDNPDSLPKQKMEELEKYLGWLVNYRADVEYWNQLVSIGKVARDLVRVEGMHTNIVDSFEQSIANIKMGYRELQFVEEMVIFLLKQSNGIKLGERFFGSTEALESLFGKIKYMENEQTTFGFTSLVLGAIAHVGICDDETIANAITSIKLKDIDDWSAREIGKSIQSERKEINKVIKNLKAEIEPELSGYFERKVMGF